MEAKQTNKFLWKIKAMTDIFFNAKSLSVAFFHKEKKPRYGYECRCSNMYTETIKIFTKTLVIKTI